MRTLIAGDSVIGVDGADAVLVDGPTVIAVGSRHELTSAAAEVRAHDGTIAPGLRDAHLHPVGIATTAGTLSLEGVARMSDLVEMLRDRVSVLSAGAPLIATDLDDERLGRLPTRIDLDRAAPDHPLVVHRICRHVAVANTAALTLAGIDADTADPSGGALDRVDGIPNGILRETAVGLVSGTLDPLIPPPDPSVVAEVLAGLLRMGLVRLDVIVATTSAPWCGDGRELEALLALPARVRPKLDVYVITDDTADLEAAAEAVRRSGDGIRFGGWKGFADGSLGGRTAALAGGYADSPGTRGTLRLRPDQDRRLVEAAHRLGGAAAIHAIGDAAVSAVLDLYESVGTDGPTRVEHASVLHPRLIARMADTGVIASVQPSFATSDDAWLSRRLGPDRVDWAYPFEALDASGVEMRFGSDAPVETPDPWVTIDNARTRLSRPRAFWPSVAEPIGPGAAADLIVIDRDPVTADDVAGTRVSAVYLDGQRTG